MAAGSVTTPNEAATEARVRERTMGTRRARMLRGMAWMVGLSVLAVLVTMYNRDVQALARDEKRMAFWRDHLAGLHERGGAAPLDLPLPPGDRQGTRDAFQYNYFYVRDAANHGRGAVAYRKEFLELFLRRSGRHVLVFDGDHFQIEWLRGELDSPQAEAMGIRKQD